MNPYINLSTQERFDPLYNDILQMLHTESTVSPKEFGTLGCSIVIERSAHVKAKTFACEQAKYCISTVGLSAIGKKGLLAVAKFLSEDPTRHRLAALDLLVEITIKMKNDVSRLSRICGSNLSEKGRQILEERINGAHVSTNSPSPVRKGDGVATELPKLSLRQRSPARQTPLPTTEDLDETPEDLFVFSTRLSSDSGDKPIAKQQVESLPVSLGTSSAAASLRARLLKIREKGMAASAEQEIAERESEIQPMLVEDSQPHEFSSQIEPIDVYISRFRSLLEKTPPLDESDNDIEKVITGLRIFHIVLAEKDGSFFNISGQEALRYRPEIMENANTSIDLIRR